MKNINHEQLENIPISTYIQLQNISKKYKSSITVNIFFTEKQEDGLCIGYGSSFDLKTISKFDQLISKTSEKRQAFKEIGIYIDGEDEEMAFEEINDYLNNRNKEVNYYD